MRILSPAADAALASPHAVAVLFVEMLLTQPIYLSTSAVTITWNAHDWLGTGSMGAIEELRDEAGESTALRFTLSGVSSDLVALALGENVRDKACRVYQPIIDPDTHVVLEVPRAWGGALDYMGTSRDGATATISVVAESTSARFRRAKPLRNNDADHQRLVPGDTSARFITSQSQHKDAWPAASFFRR